MKNQTITIVVPKSTLKQWQAEFEKWCPSVHTICLIGDHKERQQVFRAMNNMKWDVCITTYEMCICEKEPLKELIWRYMVVDEGHRIKNERIEVSAVLRAFKSINRILLTGTPFQNSLHELWSLLNFINPEEFADSNDFDAKFTQQECLRNKHLVDELQEILKPYLLRRLKCDVAKDLKGKKEIKMVATLQGNQKTRYNDILKKNLMVCNKDGKLVHREVRNLMMELRKCANHPALLDEESQFTNVADLLKICGKTQVLDALLLKLKFQGARILIFSQFKRMLDILEQLFKWREYEYFRMDGDTTTNDRNTMITQFNDENSKKFIFMSTTRAGGVGITPM